jgi:hypothetical protein
MVAKSQAKKKLQQTINMAYPRHQYKIISKRDISYGEMGASPWQSRISRTLFPYRLAQFKKFMGVQDKGVATPIQEQKYRNFTSTIIYSLTNRLTVKDRGF